MKNRYIVLIAIVLTIGVVGALFLDFWLIYIANIPKIYRMVLGSTLVIIGYLIAKSVIKKVN